MNEEKKKVNVREMVMEVVENFGEPISSPHIVTLTGSNRGTVSGAISMLCKTGKLMRDKNPIARGYLYRIPTEQEKYAAKRASNSEMFCVLVNEAKCPVDMFPCSELKERIAENKYAKKVIKALSIEPVFNEGDHVTVRSSGNVPGELSPHKEKMFFVLRALDKAIAAARGSRQYIVLSSDSAETHTIEERWLKKYKKT